MQAEICPTLTAATADEYRSQVEVLAQFATRVHIDTADASLTPNALLAIGQLWWPGGVRADIHVMYKRPAEHMPALVALGPQLVIFHAEAEGDFMACARILRTHGIEAGVALLPQTPVDIIRPGIAYIDHVLVFSGHLGSFGGQADLGLLEKVKAIKALKPGVEIGWDGGVNEHNARQLAAAGVQVLNTGGFIHKAKDPHNAYATLEKITRQP